MKRASLATTMMVVLCKIVFQVFMHHNLNKSPSYQKTSTKFQPNPKFMNLY